MTNFKEQALELSIWISQCEDFQIDLLEAIENNREKSIPRIEKEILDRKEKIKNAMNYLMQCDSTEFDEHIQAAKELLNKKQDKKPKSLKLSKKQIEALKKTKSKPNLNSKQIGALKALKKKIKPKPEFKPITEDIRIINSNDAPFNVFSIIADDNLPLSERLTLLKSMLTDTVDLIKELLSEYNDDIMEKAEESWIAAIEAALDMESEYDMIIEPTMTDTIIDVKEEELNEEEERDN